MAEQGPSPPQLAAAAAATAGGDQPELVMQELRSKATELFLREQWAQSVQLYTQLISLCQDQISAATLRLRPEEPEPDPTPKLRKSLCLALSNRAEARYRMKDLDLALEDCNEALSFEATHFKTLLCKGKVFLSLNRYASALECFKLASLDPQASASPDDVSRLLERCRKLGIQSRTGNFDISDWVLGGFGGEIPELAEFVGAVEVKKSNLLGRGLFATRSIDTGSLILVTKAIAIERGIMKGEELGENKQLVMWKNFVDRVADIVSKCKNLSRLIGTLSSGSDDEDSLDVPNIAMFRPEKEEEEEEEEEKESTCPNHEKLGMDRILPILDVNSIVEESISAKVLGRNRDYYGVGIWVLPSFVNHSCTPNARRLHIGNYLIALASRDIKAGEEISFPYIDILVPLEKRREILRNWGFRCSCKRCKFEEEIGSRPEMKEIETGLEIGVDIGSVVYRMEECMRRWGIRGKEKGYLRASMWGAYSSIYGSEKAMRKWGRRVPAPEVAVESVLEATGADDRVVKVAVDRVKRGGGGGGVVEMERVFKYGRGVYGKLIKKQALKALMEI